MMMLINNELLLTFYEFSYIAAHREKEKDVFCGLLL